MGIIYKLQHISLFLSLSKPLPTKQAEQAKQAEQLHNKQNRT